MTTDTSHIDPNALEVAPGTVHEELQGWVPELATEAEIVSAMDKAFSYRGDVTLTLKDGERLEAYIFDRRPGNSLRESYVKLFPVNSSEKRSVPYSEIARLEFSGKDRAAGHHWESWVKQYKEKKAAGEKFGLHPETLD
ncbi:MAG TPA: hypothetical protein VM554_16065 [Acidisarcina sp.]|nr:hypothetical protein [Acidisarcina sp.]